MQPENRMSVGMKGFCGKNFPVRAEKNRQKRECGYRKIYQKTKGSPPVF